MSLLGVLRLIGCQLFELFGLLWRSLIRLTALPSPGPLPPARFQGVRGMLASYRQPLPAIPDVPGAARIAGCRLTTRFDGTEQVQLLHRDAIFADVLVPLDTECENALAYFDAAGNQTNESKVQFRSVPAAEDPMPAPGPLEAPTFMGTVDDQPVPEPSPEQDEHA